MKIDAKDIAMPEGLSKLFESLKEGLEATGQKENDPIAKAEQSMRIAQQTIARIKEYVAANPFENKEAEIYFFKYIKPLFYAYLVYYSNLYQIELKIPTGSLQAQKDYYQKELLVLELQFSRNASFFEYYRSGAAYLDDIYFLRGNQDNDIKIHSWFIDADPAFSTGYDCKAAELLASNMLSDYLNKKLQNLETGTTTPPGSAFRTEPSDDLVWTDTKAGLVELGYALHARGSFNNGRATLEQIFRCFQKFFHVELDNPPRTYQQILSRESGLTVFLQSLIDSFLQRFQTVERKIKSRR